MHGTGVPSVRLPISSRPLLRADLKVRPYTNRGARSFLRLGSTRLIAATGTARTLGTPALIPLSSARGSGASAAALDRRFRESVVVELLIPYPVAVLIQPSERLIKQPRLRVAGRDRALRCVEFVFMHEDRRGGQRFIRVVQQPNLVSFDETDVRP